MSQDNSPTKSLARYQSYARQKCFVAFSKSAKWNEDLLTACEEVLSRPEFNLELDYASKSPYLSGSLQEKALALIANSRYGIYDLSSWENERGEWQLPRNVYVELGMAIALNRPTLLLRNESNHHLKLPDSLESMSGLILTFGGATTLKRTLVQRLPQWLQEPPDVGWWNRYCIPGNRVCEIRESHPGAIQWGRKTIQCHVSDGPDPGRIDFRALVDDVLGRFSDLRVIYMDTLLPMKGYDFLLCTHCKTVRSSSFAIYRITPYTPAETFIAIGISLGLEHLLGYKIPKLLLIEHPDELPSLLTGYEAVVARNDSERKNELLKFMPAVMQQLRASTWRPRPLPFIEISCPTVETPRKQDHGPAEGTIPGDGQRTEANPSREERVSLAVCHECGGRISWDDVFCAHCGARQVIQYPEANDIEMLEKPRVAVLGVNEPATFLLRKNDNLIGRTDASSHIFPDINLTKFDPDTKISRRHARIFVVREVFFVEDLGSVNGTIVNSTIRLSAPHKPHRLKHGDQLRLGETTLMFLNEEMAGDENDDLD